MLRYFIAELDEPDTDVTNVAAEVKDILNAIKQGQSTGDDEARQLRDRLSELEAVMEQRAEDQERLEKSLRVSTLK